MAGEEGLNLRTKRPRRRKAAAHRMERPEISTINQCWSMEFVADQLFNGRRFRDEGLNTNWFLSLLDAKHKIANLEVA